MSGGPFNVTFRYPVEGTVPTFNVYDSIILQYHTNITGTQPLDLKLWSNQENSTTDFNDPTDYVNLPYDGPWQIDALGDHGQFDHYPIYAWCEMDWNGTRHNPGIQFTVSSQTGVPATTWALDSLIISGTTLAVQSPISTSSTGIQHLHISTEGIS